MSLDLTIKRLFQPFLKISVTVIVSRLGLAVAIALIGLQTILATIFPVGFQLSLANHTILFFASLLASGVMAVSVWQTHLNRPKLFPAWLALAIATCCVFLASLTGLIQFLFQKSSTAPSFTDLLFLASYPLFLAAAFFLLSGGDLPRKERIQLAFDAIILALSSGLILLYLCVKSNANSLQAPSSSLFVYSLYIVGDLVLAWSLMILIMRQISRAERAPLWCMLGVATTALTSDLVSGFFRSPISNNPIFGNYADLLPTAGALFLMVAALYQMTYVTTPADTPAGVPRGAWLVGEIRLVIPYLWLVAAYLILPLSLLHPVGINPTVAIGWVAVILILVIARQVMVLHENRRLGQQLHLLNSDLEARVIERTSALTLANEELRRVMADREKAERALHEREQTLAHNALHDPLTDLPNRSLLVDRLDQAVRRMHRDPVHNFGVLYLDLDGFKVINDSLGHTAGDRLLIQIGKRLGSRMREVDTIARLGGDEFVILLEDVGQPQHLTKVAERVMAALNKPFDLDNNQVFMAASIGIVHGDPAYETPADILRDADLAMYQAKSQGKGCYVLFNPDMREQAINRLTLERDLRVALEHGQFSLQYQPILALKTGEVTGFEALIRWHHPTRGLVSPGEFIPIAESNGQIAPITQWVLGQALRQLNHWRSTFGDQNVLTVSVNLSVRLFNQQDILQRVADLLNEMDVSPKNLIIEITESGIFQDARAAASILEAWRQMGVKVHVDDFGTGYSSLSYLQQFPVHTLKIDRTFIHRIQPDGGNSEIVRAIVGLANDLGLEVIAEGIETKEQLLYARKIRVQGGQGFFISRPLTALAAGRFFSENKSLLNQKKSC